MILSQFNYRFTKTSRVGHWSPQLGSINLGSIDMSNTSKAIAEGHELASGLGMYHQLNLHSEVLRGLRFKVFEIQV